MCFSIHVAKQVIDRFVSNGIEANRIPVVIGWVGTVKDSTSVEFARRFYANLKDYRNPNAGLNYIGAYTTACPAIAGQANWDPRRIVPCLLHCDSTEGVISLVDHKGVIYYGREVADYIEENQDTEEAACGEGDQDADEHSSEDDEVNSKDEVRSLNNKTGKSEVKGLKLLGFRFQYDDGNGRKPISITEAGHGSEAGPYKGTVYLVNESCAASLWLLGTRTTWKYL